MHGEPTEPVLIELDDPATRGAGVVGAIIVLAIVGIILAPFLINTLPQRDHALEHPSRATSSRQVCQPRFDVPEFLEPVTHFALPGFMRLCDWLVPLAPPASHLTPNSLDVIQTVDDPALAAVSRRSPR